MKTENLRYIVLLIDSKDKEHDGKVFVNYNEAKEYTSDVLKDNFCTHIIIGMFYMDKNLRESNITLIESLGFSKDKKNVNQLNLFTTK